MEIKNFDKKYKEFGAYHHSLKGFKALWYKRNYELLCENTKGKILDIACGDGKLSDFADLSRIALDGFDLSRKAVNLAREKHSYGKLWIGDITDPINYNRDEYGFFICSLSLQYLSEKKLFSYFEFISSFLSRNKTYRFSFPNSDKVTPPDKMRKTLFKLFQKVTMTTITGFVKNAESLGQQELEHEFRNSISCPPEESYHYMVELKN